MSQPPGWYPNSQGQMQYWDGTQWGEVQQEQQQQSAPPPPGYGAPPPPGYGAAPPPPPAYGYGQPAPPVYGQPAYGYGYGSPPLPQVLQGKEFADFGIRVGAYLIDIVIYFVALAVAVGIAVALDNPVGWVLFALIFIGAWFIPAFFMARQGEKNGMTIGKQVCNIRVLKEDGQAIGFGFAALREVAVRQLLIGFVGGFFFVVPLLDLLWPLWDDKKQALHDKIVSTYVVRA